MPFITLFNIFPSLIKPYIPKCLVACGQALNTHLDKIIILQKQALCLICICCGSNLSLV